MTLWQGPYEGHFATWLRWCDRQGAVLQTGDEKAAELKATCASLQTFREADQIRADRAEADAARAREEAARYARMLADLGIDPDAAP